MPPPAGCGMSRMRAEPCGAMPCVNSRVLARRAASADTHARARGMRLCATLTQIMLPPNVSQEQAGVPRSLHPRLLPPPSRVASRPSLTVFDCALRSVPWTRCHLLSRSDAQAFPLPCPLAFSLCDLSPLPTSCSSHTSAARCPLYLLLLPA